MDLQKLRKNCISIFVLKADFNYQKKIFKMTVNPDGCKKPIAGKAFGLKFLNCIYLSAANLYPPDPGGFGIEFIAWGEKPEDCCQKGDCKLLEKILKERLNPYPPPISLKKENGHHYFFQNTFGDQFDIIASDCEVSENKTLSRKTPR